VALPAVYSKEELKMLEQWNTAEQDVGWIGEYPIPGKMTYPVVYRVATKDAISDWARGTQNHNPLFHDEEYTRHTRWGTIIASPFFQQNIAPQGTVCYRIIPPEVGIGKTMDPGAPQYDYTVMWTVFPQWEFFKPIRPGDSFRVWCGPNVHEDLTNPDGKGPRIFQLHDQVKYFNQKNELVTIRHKKLKFYIISQKDQKVDMPLIKPDPVLEKYKYTKEEIDYLDNVRNSEILRGAQIRWWEDVKIGEELQPVSNGPSTVWEQILHVAYLQHLNTTKKSKADWAEVREKSGYGTKATEGKQATIPPHVPVRDPESGIWRNPIEHHFVDLDRMGHGRAKEYATVVMNVWWCVLGRLLTNWMGDDGFLKKAAFDRMDNQIVGDTIIGRGKVIRKYIENEDEHMVDVVCWLESLRGYIIYCGTATISLFSRESLDKDLMRF
jgi:acyl dehydratase